MESLNQSLFALFFAWAHKSFFLDGFIIFIAQYLPYFMGLLALGWIFSLSHARERWFVLCETLLAVLLSRGIITQALHFFYDHPRAFRVVSGVEALLSETSNSFPSGHAAFLFALSFVIFAYNRRWGLVFFLVSLLNGAARVVAGVHWPLDILGGVFVGLLSAFIIHLLLRNYFPGRKDKEAEAQI